MLSKILFSLLLLTISNTSFGQESTDDPVVYSGPKYSKIKNLSDSEVERQFAEFTGTKDSWRTASVWFHRAKNLMSFRNKPTVSAESLNLSYIHDADTNALKQYVIVSQSSRYPEIRGVVATIRGDKYLVRKTFQYTKNHDSRSLLYFFKTLDAGDTGIELKKFNEFPLAFELLARDISVAAERAKALSLPMVLEFESSSLGVQAPITRLLYHAIADDRSNILKMELTPDGGRLISIDSLHAENISKLVDQFSKQFSRKVRGLRDAMFKEPNAQRLLLALLRKGEGLPNFSVVNESSNQCKGLFKKD